MPSYIVPCPKCTQNIQVDESLLGQDVICPICQEPITIPALQDVRQNNAQPDSNSADTSTENADSSPDNSQSVQDEAIDKTEPADNHSSEDNGTTDNAASSLVDLDGIAGTPDAPLDAYEAKDKADERNGEGQSRLALTAFRESLRNRGALGANLANSDFPAKLQSEASAIRRILRQS